MGFSVSVSSVIFFSAFILLSGIVIGVGLDYQRTVERAQDERDELERSRDYSELTLTGWTMSDNDLVMTLKNTGDAAIDLDKLTILSNGGIKEIRSMVVDGSDAGYLFQDETMTLTVSNVYLNASSKGGNLIFTSSYHFSSPERICSDTWIHVSDGTKIVTLDEMGDLEWVKGTGLSSINDTAVFNGTVLVLGDDRILSCPVNGSSGFTELVGTGMSDASRMITSNVTGSDPYILVLENSGNIIRFDIDGSNPLEICTNGTNVNWTSPADMVGGEDFFYLLDENGTIHRITYAGTDVLVGSLSLEGGEKVVSGTSTGLDKNQVMALVSNSYRDRILVLDTSDLTEIELAGSLGEGKIDISLGSGIHVLDPLDGRVEAYEIGTSIKLIARNGYHHLEVI
jgi:archaellum component FlaF (FlaF/FlaG flagellin family)